MASIISTRDFFASGTPQQYDFTLSHYDKALRLKAESKSSKPENVIKLDKWYQNDLPKKIKSRGKDAHLVHDELVQTIKWKLQRGKFRPNLVNLVQMNTPRVVMQETKKAFRQLQKKNDLQIAANALCNLKGVGPGLASAVLAAGAPHIAPFMADECLLAMPEVDGLDYTMKEYMRFVEYVKSCVERLNSLGGTTFTPHTVELAVWTHSILREHKPELLEEMPEANATPAPPPAVSEETPEAAPKPEAPTADEDTKSSMASSAADEDSNAAPEAKIHNSEEEKTPSENAPVEPAEAPSESTTAAAEAETTPAETEVVAKNGNKEPETPKTNGSNSHSNGSEKAEEAGEASGETASAPEVVEANNTAKEQEKQNGASEKPVEEEAKATEQQKPNGELENGVKSSENTDLRSSSPSGGKRSLDSEAADEPPATKKLKTCDDDASTEAAAEATASPAKAPNSTPQVAV